MLNDITLHTRISLTTEQRRLLEAEAARTARSISALIRDAVSLVYGSQWAAADDLRAIDAASGLGVNAMSAE